MIPENQQQPAVIFWFKFYAASLSFLYLLILGFSLFLIFGDTASMEIEESFAKILGAFMLVVSLALMVACFLPLMLAPRPWLWVYNLVIICLGMTSACYLIVCIPLLIFWLKPETQRCYGKNVI
jgi:hypothetical protein